MKKRLLLVSSLLAVASIITISKLVSNERTLEPSILDVDAAEHGEFIPDTELKDSYLIGESFSIPTGKINFTSGGSTKTLDIVNSYIVFPDDNAKNIKTIKFTDIGKYTLVYLAKDGNTTVKATKNFKVYSEAYSFSSEGSSATYTEHLPTVKEDKKGLTISLKDGDTFTYNQPINLKGSTLESEPVINFAPHCFSNNAEHPTMDAQVFYIRVTDVYDKDNYFEVVYKQEGPGEVDGDIRHQYYVRAKSGTQAFTGLEVNNNANITIDGIGYKLHQGSMWGASPQDTSHVVEGHAATQSNADDLGMRILYDDETKRLYTEYTKRYLITDLDEPSIYGKNTFKGFTTGDAIISVRCEYYEEKTANIDIHSFKGRSGEALKDTILYDNDAPTINFAADIDNFKIAIDEDFTIPSATYSDLNPKGNLLTEVYYEKGTNIETFVPVSNGKFKPIKSGNYTIVYSATDLYGNVSKAEKHCFAVTTSTKTANSLEVQKLNNIKAGQNVELPNYTLTTLNNGAYCNVKAIFEDGSVVKPIDNKLFFSKVGKYQIVYTYGDAVSTNSMTYEIDAVANEEYHYIESLAMPKYLINNTSFSLERTKVTLVNSKELKTDKSDIYADFGSGYKLINDPLNVKVEDGATNANFQFKYNGKVVKEVKNVPIIDVGFGKSIRYKDYFAGDITADATDAINLKTNSTSGNTNIDFINTVLFQTFKLNLNLNEKNFERLEIVLTDYYDLENKQIIEVYPNSVGYDVVAEGVTVNFLGTTNLSLNRSKTTGKFMVNNDYELPIENKFRNGRAYLSFNLYGLTGQETLSVSSINNHNLSSNTKDNVNPEIYVPENSGSIPFNTDILVDVAVCNDVATPFVATNLTEQVYFVDNDGNRSEVTSNDGTLLAGNQNPLVEYTFKATKYGTYYVAYDYVDLSKRRISYNNALYVKDNIAPVINIDDGFNDSTIVKAILGEEITAKSFTVSDNMTASGAIKTSVYVMTPMLEMINITESMKFTVNLKGDYKINYVAIDDNGNLASKSYTVRVA